ncbi:MAG TPA: dockerin type I domain-containing protein, partial [Usitatibacteraceae bacterium]|nr:dockerin type I domain-containing protein [Usitatibacteraceae bacterium]
VNGSSRLVFSMGFLVGDANSNGVVNARDLSATKSKLNQQINSANFFYDVNLDGVINFFDVVPIRGRAGKAIQ